MPAGVCYIQSNTKGERLSAEAVCFDLASQFGKGFAPFTSIDSVLNFHLTVQCCLFMRFYVLLLFLSNQS